MSTKAQLLASIICDHESWSYRASTRTYSAHRWPGRAKGVCSQLRGQGQRAVMRDNAQHKVTMNSNATSKESADSTHTDAAMPGAESRANRRSCAAPPSTPSAPSRGSVARRQRESSTDTHKKQNKTAARVSGAEKLHNSHKKHTDMVTAGRMPQHRLMKA